MGGVNPSPKGKRDGWKRKRSKPPTPRGLVGLQELHGLRASRFQNVALAFAPCALVLQSRSFTD
eukprot:6498034-Pyramimonas_sp.AAC.1